MGRSVVSSASITNISGRDAAEARLVKLCNEHLNISRRVADSLAEVVHELITNAMYDAPVDAQGEPATLTTAPPPSSYPLKTR